jgi:hypothetical protein
MAGIYRMLAILPMANRGSMPHDEPMFAPYCPRHRSHVLLSTDDMTIRNTPQGPIVSWTCSCGYHGTTAPRRALATAAAFDRECA